MRAVNLIPADAKRGSRGPSASKGLPTYLFLGVLAVAVGLVTLYVLASNNISQREAKVTTLQAEVAQVQAQSTSLDHYAQFSQMTQSRIGSVRQLATGRFDWHSTLTQIAQVVPKNTTLATLAGTAATSDPTAAATAAATGTGAPAGTSIALTGCTKSQPDVAKLMSRLRLIDGVASVTLNSSTKQDGGSSSPGNPPASTPAPSSSGAGGSGGGCGNGTPSFDLQISFATAATPATPASGAATSTSTATPTSAAPSTSGGAS